MTIVLKDRPFLKRYVISKINHYIWVYKNKFDIESIYFNTPIDGIVYFKVKPISNDERYYNDWYDVEGQTLIKILKALKSKDFYGYCRTREHKLVKIIPKK